MNIHLSHTLKSDCLVQWNKEKSRRMKSDHAYVLGRVDKWLKRNKIAKSNIFKNVAFLKFYFLLTDHTCLMRELVRNEISV